MNNAYRFRIYMENYYCWGPNEYVSKLILDFFGEYGCTIYEAEGTYNNQFEHTLVVEFVYKDAVAGQAMCKRFSKDFCEWYKQECTMITMEPVQMEMCYGDA